MSHDRSSESRHGVVIHEDRASEHRLLECTYCGPLGVSRSEIDALGAKKIHEGFGAVLRDVMDR